MMDKYIAEQCATALTEYAEKNLLYAAVTVMC